MPTPRSLVAVARGKPASVIGSAGACAAFGPGLDGPEGGADGRLPCCLDLVGPPLARGREGEMLWDRATPLKLERSAAPDSRLMRAQQAVLELMAEGLHDDAIARRAGISTTTVRRHITAILQRLDVTSRFAAGAAAQRRGWIG